MIDVHYLFGQKSLKYKTDKIFSQNAEIIRYVKNVKQSLISEILIERTTS